MIWGSDKQRYTAETMNISLKNCRGIRKCIIKVQSNHMVSTTINFSLDEKISIK